MEYRYPEDWCVKTTCHCNYPNCSNSKMKEKKLYFAGSKFHAI